jgi:hypothetical protein
MRFVFKSLTAIAAVVAVTSGANAHWDRPSCYIEAHYECHVDSTCSDDDYQFLLDNCDKTYPSASRPRPGGLKTPSSGGLSFTK